MALTIMHQSHMDIRHRQTEELSLVLLLTGDLGPQLVQHVDPAHKQEQESVSVLMGRLTAPTETQNSEKKLGGLNFYLATHVSLAPGQVGQQLQLRVENQY